MAAPPLAIRPERDFCEEKKNGPGKLQSRSHEGGSVDDQAAR
jgi:hypothetical protein